MKDKKNLYTFYIYIYIGIYMFFLDIYFRASSIFIGTFLLELEMRWWSLLTSIIAMMSCLRVRFDLELVVRHVVSRARRVAVGLE